MHITTKYLGRHQVYYQHNFFLSTEKKPVGELGEIFCNHGTMQQLLHIWFAQQRDVVAARQHIGINWQK